MTVSTSAFVTMAALFVCLWVLVTAGSATSTTLRAERQRRAQAEEEETKYGFRNPYYFDDLRARAADPSDSRVRMDPPSNTSNVFKVFVQEEEDDELNRENEYHLASINALLPYTRLQDKEMEIRASVHDDAAALLLAIYHFNTAEVASIIDSPTLYSNYGLCNVRLTAEISNTEFSPIESTRLLTNILDRPADHIEEPLPTAVIGAYRSACTSPTAILTGVVSVPQISYHSSSTDFDNTEQYPVFGRTVPSSTGDARAVVDYLKLLKVSHIGVIFVTDAFGSAYQKTFQDAAGETMDGNPIHTDSVSFSYKGGQDEIDNAVLSLKNTKYRYFLAVVGEEHFDLLMTAAYKQGIVGPKYFWLFTSGMDLATFQQKAQYKKGSPLAIAAQGIGIIHVEGGERKHPLRAKVGTADWNDEEEEVGEQEDSSQATPPGDAEKTTTPYDEFRKSWKLMSTELQDYFRDKQPYSSDGKYDFRKVEFSSEPSQHSYFIYDAVVSLGLAMCNAPQEYFDGAQLYANFTSGPRFPGVSGDFRIGSTGSREYDSVVFTVWNMRPRTLVAATGNEEEDVVVFDAYPTAHYKKNPAYVENPTITADNIPKSKWTLDPLYGFVYPDGTTNQPKILPDLDTNENLIGLGSRAVGVSLMVVVILLAVASGVFTFVYRESKVIKASQPYILFLVSFGCVLMSLAIWPLSYDESITDNSKVLNHACMAGPWLYSIGFAVAFAALFSKTWTTNRVLQHEMSRVKVSMPLLVKCLVLFVTLNVALLLLWTSLAPLEWIREYNNTKDSFDRSRESIGLCKSEETWSLAFASILIAVNMLLLLFANWQAYQARDIVTEYQEGRYVAISMASILQAWCMGIPIMIVVWEAPQAKFFVATGIIFVTCTAVLCLIYGPKAMAVRSEKHREDVRNTRERFGNMGSGAGAGAGGIGATGGLSSGAGGRHSQNYEEDEYAVGVGGDDRSVGTPVPTGEATGERGVGGGGGGGGMAGGIHVRATANTVTSGGQDDGGATTTESLESTTSDTKATTEAGKSQDLNADSSSRLSSVASVRFSAAGGDATTASSSLQDVVVKMDDHVTTTSSSSAAPAAVSRGFKSSGDEDNPIVEGGDNGGGVMLHGEEQQDNDDDDDDDDDDVKYDGPPKINLSMIEEKVADLVDEKAMGSDDKELDGVPIRQSPQDDPVVGGVDSEGIRVLQNPSVSY